MLIYHPHGVYLAGYGWFEEKNLYFNTQIRVYHILFTVETTMLQLKILMTSTLFYCKVSSELVHSVHPLLICSSSFN